MASLLTTACGREDEASIRAGRYGTRVLEATTNCAGSDAPPPLTGFLMDVTRVGPDSVTVVMSPIVELEGHPEGDSLVATMRMDIPISLPDSIAGRADPADSLGIVSYQLRAEFRGDSFGGEYVIHAPDLNALVDGLPEGRCRLRYVLSGEVMPPPAPPGGSS